MYVYIPVSISGWFFFVPLDNSGFIRNEAVISNSIIFSGVRKATAFWYVGLFRIVVNRTK